MMVEMVTDYNKNEWVNLWTGDTIIPPNNQDRFLISIFAAAREQSVLNRIPTVKLKIPGKLFFKVGSRTSVTFKL